MNYKSVLKSFVVFAIVVISGVSSVAQENPKIDINSFFSNSEDYDSGNKYFKTAEKYYRKGKGTYDEALKYYLKLYRYNENSHALNYKIGICYLLSSDRGESLNYLLKSSPETAKDYYLVLGKAYQYNRNYLEAKEAYLDYLNSLKKWQQKEQTPQIDQFIAECNYSARLTKDSSDVFIINLGPLINTYYDEYAAYLPPNDSNIYLTSTRPKSEPRKRVSRYKFKESIYAADNCIYEPAQWVSGVKELNKRVNVSMAGVDPDDKNIFFYEGKKNTGRLMIASYNSQKDKWNDIHSVKGKINHIAFRETSIAIGPDKKAYFISNRRGSVGGKDIWVADYMKKDKWGKPYNIGTKLNTPFDEEGIYISDDGNTLYFSSNGHLGMGGYDVYKSVKLNNGSWSEPINMGHPVNSPADELFYHPTQDTMVALYSTIRGDSEGGLDIYKIQVDPRKPFYIEGTVLDAETGRLLSATVTVLDNNTAMPILSAPVDTISGLYSLDFEDIGDYSLQIDKAGYKTVVDTIECPKKKRETIVLDYELELIKHPFTLRGSVKDIDNNYLPLQAILTFVDTVNNKIYGRQYTDSIGNYSITFGDKYDMLIHVESKDYFELDTFVYATKEPGSIINRDLLLKRSKIDYTLTGIVSDEANQAPVYGDLSFYRPNEDDPFAIVTTDSISGKYTAVFEEKGPFLIEVEAGGFFFLNSTYRFNGDTTLAIRNFGLKKMSTGAKIVVENILFNTGKSTLKPESFPELNKLAVLLIKNEDVRIEVSGHTDNVGSAALNKRLSKARALTVKNYLVSRGVEEERMEYEGYGFDQPIAPNETKEGRAQNRRVEIKVLE